jgi:hypothetical protein
VTLVTFFGQIHILVLKHNLCQSGDFTTLMTLHFVAELDFSLALVNHLASQPATASPVDDGYEVTTV